MKTSKEKILQALSALLPEDARQEVVAAVDNFMEETKAALEADYEQKLQDAFETIAQEKDNVEKIAEQGYAEAYSIICDLRDRLEVQKEEFELALEEGYEEAYQMLLAEKTKNENLSVDLYDEYDKKLSEIKEYIVDKIDQFLSLKGEEFYEMAKKDVLNDPYYAEHKVALEKILEVAANYLTEDEYINATSSKVEELTKVTDSLKNDLRILEAKNMRLATENTKLNKAVRHQHELLTEGVKNEQNDRVKKARTVEGRGQRHTDNQVVIGEHVQNETAANNDANDKGTRFVEQIGHEITEQWGVLAGVKNKK